eukprot:TRINITY_DN16806_c2_g2_i1.p1 TRINITY_DN16806_c2_g2~~TRINITY_DN16806_c2_g2_i1.p1  ORF type:complete len:240 (+),score=19.12 TRINITY_DN16806_c2_g2_i1:68-721(+)
MWVINYALCSILMDVIFAAVGVWNVVVGGWLFYMRCGLKLVLLVLLVWRFSCRTSKALVVAILLGASMLFTSTICKMLSDILGSTPAQEEIVALWSNRVVEAPVMLVSWVKLSMHDANQRVVPLRSVDTSKFVSRTCTWVELCGSCDGTPGIENNAACSMCLERLELDELVTQLTCNHFFHTHCASQWMLRCMTHCSGGNVCPMRCHLTEFGGPSAV